MRKTYFFLLLMLVTLPSIGLTRYVHNYRTIIITVHHGSNDYGVHFSSLEALAELAFNTTNGTSVRAIENQLK